MESIFCPEQLRLSLADVLFSHYLVGSILFAPSQLMALLPLGLETGLVVDCGFLETTVLPIFQGTPVLRGLNSVPLAGQAVHRHIDHLTQIHGRVFVGSTLKPLAAVQGHLPPNILEVGDRMVFLFPLC